MATNKTNVFAKTSGALLTQVVYAIMCGAEDTAFAQTRLLVKRVRLEKLLSEAAKRKATTERVTAALVELHDLQVAVDQSSFSGTLVPLTKLRKA